MYRQSQTALVFIFLLFVGTTFAQDDWARWRGPNGNGIAASAQKPPVEWSDDSNIAWKTKVHGRGHSSPIIVGKKIFLTTADEQAQTQSVLCFDRDSGKQLWKTQVNQGGFNSNLHRKNTHASPSVASDGERVFAVFNNHDRIQAVALDFSGKKVWERIVGQFKCKRYQFGFGTSPIVYNSNVIVTNQNAIDSAIVAYDGRSGSETWRIDLPNYASYSTPVVATIGGKPQMLLSGHEAVRSFDPKTGDLFWECPALWEVTCGTMVWDENAVFASGGYPPQQTLAVKSDGTGKRIWDNGIKIYEQSMIVVDGFLFGHAENGSVYCWQLDDGKEKWKQRFQNRRIPQSASPVFANGNLYFTAENGETLVIAATSKGFQPVSRNQLGDEAFASMAFCGNQIFTRVATIDADSDQRQEWLVCIGEED